jgi:hypothetical protein
MSVFRLVCGIVPVFALVACGNQESLPADQVAFGAHSADLCLALNQKEVDDLLQHDAGSGRSQTLENGIRQCAWPAQGVPELIVQLVPSERGGVQAAAAVGEGFLVLDVPDMGTEAAVSVLNPAAGSGLEPNVGIFALAVGNRILRIAPLKLGIVRDSDRYQALLMLGKSVSSRLRDAEVGRSTSQSQPSS